MELSYVARQGNFDAERCACGGCWRACGAEGFRINALCTCRGALVPLGRQPVQMPLASDRAAEIPPLALLVLGSLIIWVGPGFSAGSKKGV